MLQEKDKVPNFSLMLSDGSQVSRASLMGTPYVLFFYPKDCTPGCTQEAIDFTGLMPQFQKLGCRVIGVSKDSPDSHLHFRQKYDLGVELATDETGKVMEAFGCWVEKSMYGKTHFGVERSTFLVGSEGRILNAWRKVKVPGHAEAVLKAARATLEG